MAHYGSRSKLKLKVKYYITFPVCNLLTRAKSRSSLSVASRIRPDFYAEFTLFK
ncbi:hypothetical protein [Leptospira noguchii]|uniref:Uncharacterized protein n=1 Tax=Leptospira noguchii serovar Autumnalis str. ZUN142 TaxID=1085540 RepID=M6U7U0_9LEPT|nr:hypothetical protein [Leptospira noguchii]EMO41082.1 hypothetical protein LEP1GSC186_4735 [Leptospira noguchii serovar Autumnalis str. ZUN142]UOG30215.1 hypothetical protein MAL06_16770 [Leptospira noguchii]UOG52246.1 hypothetical protein MAL09_16850 [Leptospira noguchii]